MVSVRIPLTQGKFARVSVQDAERVMAFKWAAHKTRKEYDKWYAMRWLGTPGAYEPMHRFILSATSPQVDHIDGNGLNNIRSNIREATPQQNSGNRDRPSNNTSGYKGVSWQKDKKKWRATITHNGKQRFIGLFDDAREAAKAYNRVAPEVYGEFAFLNDLG